LSWEEALPFLTQEQFLTTRNMFFAGNYDVNMLGKHESKAFQKALYVDGEADYLVGNQTYHIKYIPRKILKIRKGDSKKTWMFYDSWGFFQSRFEKALVDWNIEADPIIHEGKERREHFTPADIDFAVRYNAAECRALVKLMDALNAKLEQVNLKLHDFHGAGAIASKMLNEIKARQFFPKRVPQNIARAKRAAYFGGRVELLKRGEYKKVISVDKSSCYPTAFLTLPNLRDGEWIVVDGRQLHDDDFALVEVEWNFPDAIIGPFPFRRKNDYVLFPAHGSGVYHNIEVKAAQRFVKKFDYEGSMLIGKAWLLVPSPSGSGQRSSQAYTYPFREYINRRAKERLEWKHKKDFAHIPLKLGLNSCFGKVAQRPQYEGHKPFFRELLAAGYITAYGRSQLLTYADPEHTIMFATDSLKSLVPVKVPLGENLGEWEIDEWSSAIFVLAGIYGYADKKGEWHNKTRGFRELDVRETFNHIIHRTRGGDYQTVTGHDRQFIGVRKHLSQYKAYPEPCKFVVIDKEIDWDNNAKRDFTPTDNAHSTPYSETTTEWSKPYQERFSTDDPELEIFAE
jgi:hypothetical protein